MKTNVLSADILSKFIVIASASRSDKPAGENMIRTTMAHQAVAQMGRAVQGIELVTGFYRETIAEKGSYEQSMAIAVNSVKALKALKTLFCGTYQQDCILVWNRDTDSVWLVNENGFLAELGKRGLRKTWSSLHAGMVNNWVEPDAYTVACDGSVWEVR